MTDHDIEPAPKPVPRTGWAICGVCWCVVADLDLHTAHAHPEETP